MITKFSVIPLSSKPNNVNVWNLFDGLYVGDNLLGSQVVIHKSNGVIIAIYPKKERPDDIVTITNPKYQLQNCRKASIEQLVIQDLGPVEVIVE